MFDDLKQKIDGLLKLAVAGAIAAAAGVVAFFCFAIALFLWVERGYGTLEAWLALGALFVGVAVIAGIVMLVVRRRPPPERIERVREAPSPVARMLQEPAVLLTGLQILRTLGLRNVLPVILLGAVAGGFLLSRNGHSHAAHRSQHDPAGQERGMEAE